MNIFVEGTLPISIKGLNGQPNLKLKKFLMKPMTVQQALDLQSKLKPDQYIAIAEICEQVEMIDDGGQSCPLTYEALMSSSSQNLNYLTTKKAELDAKEQAES